MFKPKNILDNLDLSKTGWEVFLGPQALASQWKGDQELYARLRQASIELAIECLNEDDNLTAENLYLFLADKRRQIAISLKQDTPYFNVGKIREPISRP